MSERPYMPLYVDAFVADTTHLTCEEAGAYLLLLMSMWRHNGRVPDDDRDNARICRLTVRKWRAIKHRLQPLLMVENGELTQKRLQKEWSRSKEFSKKQSQNARARWHGANNKNNGLDNATAMPSVAQPRQCLHTIPLVEEDTNVSSLSSDDDATRQKRLPKKEAFDLYNLVAQDLNLPIARSLTPERDRKLGARLREHGLPGWKQALKNLTNSPHLLGHNDRSWRADLDFLLQPSKLNRVIEGFYLEQGDDQ